MVTRTDIGTDVGSDDQETRKNINDCRLCLHFVVCAVRIEAARERLRLGETVFIYPNCECWTENREIGIEITRRDTLANIMKIVEQGRIAVVVKVDADHSYRLVGGYDNIEAARIAARGQDCTFLVKT